MQPRADTFKTSSSDVSMAGVRAAASDSASWPANMDHFDDGLRILMLKTGIDQPNLDKLVAWCDDLACHDAMSFSLMADTVPEINEAIVKASGLDENAKMLLAMKKLWVWSKEATAQPGNGTAPVGTPASSNQTLDDEMTLGKGVHENLDTVWLKAYCFNLPGMRLLCDGLFNSMYRQLTDKPIRLCPPTLENTKLRSATISNELKGTLVTAGGNREFSRPFENVTNVHDLWIRINAVFTTICYIKCSANGFFIMEQLDAFVYRMLDLLNARVRGQRPPAAFFLAAYNDWMAKLCQTLRTTSSNLGDILDAGHWERHFTDYVPGQHVAVPGTDGRPMSQLGDGSTEQQATLADLVNQMSQMQAEKVRQDQVIRNLQRQPQRDQPQDKGKGKANLRHTRGNKRSQGGGGGGFNIQYPDGQGGGRGSGRGGKGFGSYKRGRGRGRY